MALTPLSGGIAFACATFVWIAGQVSGRPLPTLVWATALLFVAVENDVRKHVIPNWLTFPSMIVALALGAWLDGLPGAAQAAVGLILGLLFYVPSYALGTLGAGDVKAMMAVGALVGPTLSVSVALRAFLIAALLGLFWLAWRREVRTFTSRWVAILLTTLATRKLNYMPPPEGSAAQTGIPFAAALALGLAWAWLNQGGRG